MILVIQGQLTHYRREVFNAMCDLDNVTVVHSGMPSRAENDRFSEVVLPVRKIGPFRWQKGIGRLVAELRPKTVIAMFDLRWFLTIWAMYRNDRSLNWVWWGLSIGQSNLALRAKLALAKRDNPIVFYHYVTRDAFLEKIASHAKLFVANNSLHVSDRLNSYAHTPKNRIINVGSLDARKQNDVTIKVLHKILQDTQTDIRLTLIGEGQEYENLRELIDTLGIGEHVELLGQIEDTAILARYYAESIASVSFGQAGLAVLQSMAFGVPFVTRKDAISGGEINNIRHGENGILCDNDPADLERVMRRLISAPDEARQLGRAAYDYYSGEATIENMVANFKKAIDYAERQRDQRIR